MKIYIGADHAGYLLKEKIKKFLDKKGVEYVDLGGSGKKNDDYPDFAKLVGNQVRKEKDSRGILICGTGIGMCIAANKIKGIRAGFVFDSYSSKMSKEHNDINVICLRGRKFSQSKAIRLVGIWLNEKFDGSARHKRRIKKIKSLERGR